VQLTQEVDPANKKPPPFLPSTEQQFPILDSLPKIAGFAVQPSKHCNLGSTWAYATVPKVLILNSHYPKLKLTLAGEK
jgi:hypothetical protein